MKEIADARSELEWVTQVAQCTELLEAIVADHSRLGALDLELRRRLLTAAGRISHPDPVARRRLAREFRRRERAQVQRADAAVLERTGMRTLRRASVFPTPLPGASAHALADPTAPTDRKSVV